MAARDLQHARKVAADNGVRAFVPVAAQMRAEADAVRLVHTDVDAPRAVGHRGRRDQLFEKGVGGLVVGQKHLLVFLEVCERGPVQRAVHMPQRLNAGAQLDAEEIGVIVQRAQFVHRIAPALVAEVGLLRHLVGILGVHHAEIKAHQRHFAQKIAEGFWQQHRVAGDIEHHARRLKAGMFLDGKGVLCPMLAQQGERAVRLHRLRPFDLRAACVFLHAQAAPAPQCYGKAARFGAGKAQLRRQKRKGFVEMLRQRAGKREKFVHVIAPCLRPVQFG